MKKTLYVYRPLINVQELYLWAKNCGFSYIEPLENFHVTIAYSKELVEHELIVPSQNILIVQNGPRKIVNFGSKSALIFESKDLSARHNGFRNIGASWDYPEYYPHVTFAQKNYGTRGLLPYEWPLVFGPERIEEIK